MLRGNDAQHTGNYMYLIAIQGVIFVIVGEKRIKSSILQCNPSYVSESSPDLSCLGLLILHTAGRGGSIE